jgi:hypothetical protein
MVIHKVGTSIITQAFKRSLINIHTLKGGKGINIDLSENIPANPSSFEINVEDINKIKKQGNNLVISHSKVFVTTISLI